MNTIITYFLMIASGLTLFLAGLEIILRRAYEHKKSQTVHYLYICSYTISTVLLICFLV